MQGIGDAEAPGRGDGQGELLLAQLHPVVADGDHARQHGVGIQLDRQLIVPLAVGRVDQQAAEAVVQVGAHGLAVKIGRAHV